AGPLRSEFRTDHAASTFSRMSSVEMAPPMPCPASPVKTQSRKPRGGPRDDTLEEAVLGASASNPSLHPLLGNHPLAMSEPLAACPSPGLHGRSAVPRA